MKKVVYLLILVFALGSCTKDKAGCYTCTLNDVYDTKTENNISKEYKDICNTIDGVRFASYYDAATGLTIQLSEGTTVSREYLNQDSLTRTVVCTPD